MQNEKLQLRIEEFFARYQKLNLSKKDIIISSNENIEYVYFLKKGFIRQYEINENGDEINLHIFSPNSYFPIMLVLSGEKNRYYFETLTESLVYKAPKDAVLEFIKSDNDVSYDLNIRFAKGLVGLLNRAESNLYKDAYFKVKSTILFLAEKFGKKVDNEIFIDIELTHSDVASWVGLQRETVSRQIEKLEKESFLRNEGRKLYVKRDVRY